MKQKIARNRKFLKTIMMTQKLNDILGNQFLRNLKLFFLLVLVAVKVIGLNLIKHIIVKFVNLLLLHQIHKKVLGQDKPFSTRLPFAERRLEKFTFLWVIQKILQQK